VSRRFPSLALPAPAVLLLLLAVPAATTPALPDGSRSAQAYVQGRLALADRQLDVAARLFDEALRHESDAMLRRRALDVALTAGDLKAAARLAQVQPVDGEGAGSGDSLVVLTRLAAAAAAREWRAYDVARSRFPEPSRSGEGPPLVGTILEAYSLAAREAWDTAVSRLDPGAARGVPRSYFLEHRAHVLALARRWPEAADAYAELVAGEGAPVARLRIAAAGAALEAARSDQRYRDRAIAILGGGPAADPLLDAARARLRAEPDVAGRRLGELVARPADGIGLLFVRIAADFGRERVSPGAIGFARLSTLLAPHIPETWFITADILARSDQPALALGALEAMPRRSAWGVIADTRRAQILAGEERFAEATALLAGLANRPGAGLEDWSRLADVQRRAGDPAAAARSLDRAIALIEGRPPAEQGQLWFLRGAAHELAGNFAAAEADLRRAVALQPDNAIYLNYLGYSLLDRGLKIDEARALIRRAYAAAPDNGAIIDSMGWAEYLAGNYADAVRLLEKARAAEPADPTVAEHLGDALWRAGRRIEARHAWSSALALGPEAAKAKGIATKLDYGLDLAFARR
jgi:tetratricopeptide (TPR) repeat protein